MECHLILNYQGMMPLLWRTHFCPTSGAKMVVVVVLRWGGGLVKWANQFLASFQRPEILVNERWCRISMITMISVRR